MKCKNKEERRFSKTILFADHKADNAKKAEVVSSLLNFQNLRKSLLKIHVNFNKIRIWLECRKDTLNNEFELARPGGFHTRNYAGPVFPHPIFPKNEEEQTQYLCHKKEKDMHMNKRPTI